MRFDQFASAHGLIIDDVTPGRWVRTKTTDHPSKKNGAYFFDGDYGFVQNWATMTEVATWIIDKVMTAVDHAALQRRMAKARREQALERARMQQQAASKALGILSSTTLEQHAYLDGKGFPEHRGLVYRPDEKTNLLCVPMRVGRDVVGVQMINIDGQKKFLYGQRCGGAEFVMGTDGVDIWCEGYVTGLSISAAMSVLRTRCKIHVCFSAGNMETMAKAAGSGFVVADNDVSETGEKAAKETVLPFFMPPEKGSDFNDFHRSAGTFKASQALRHFMLESVNG